MMELVDEAQCVAAHPRARAIVEVGGLLTVDPDRALEPALEQSDRLQQSKLGLPPLNLVGPIASCAAASRATIAQMPGNGPRSGA